MAVQFWKLGFHIQKTKCSHADILMFGSKFFRVMFLYSTETHFFVPSYISVYAKLFIQEKNPSFMVKTA